MASPNTFDGRDPREDEVVSIHASRGESDERMRSKNRLESLWEGLPSGHDVRIPLCPKTHLWDINGWVPRRPRLPEVGARPWKRRRVDERGMTIDSAL
jgi:hypothetical protein